MSAATASVADVSRGDLILNTSWERSNAGRSENQCSPVPLPALGTQRIVQGNGTNVGTVISLQCPAMHKLMGTELKCILSSNATKWFGAPYCKPLISDFGFRVAVLASIVSVGIIVFMSLAFITCCLLDCLKESDGKQEELDLWQWEEPPPSHQEDVRRPRRGHKSRNNNNNNSQEQRLSLWDAHNPVFCDDVPNYRCESSPVSSLPGLEHVDPLLPQPSTALTSHPRPPPSLYRPTWTNHTSAAASRGAVLQNGPSRGPEASHRSIIREKEFSIRVISV